MAIVSIITPAYNAGPWIGQAVQSVCAQTCEDWELIIVDDGSTDDTANVLAGFDDPRIRVIHQANGGVSAARNVGLDHATGVYLTFLDADDLLPPDSLALRVAYLEDHPEVGIVDGAVAFLADDMTRELRRYQPRTTTGPLFAPLSRLEDDVFAGPFYMLRRELVGQVRFQVGLTHAEDILFFLTLAHATRFISTGFTDTGFTDTGLLRGSVPEVTYRYRVGHTSAMANLAGLGRGYLAVLRALGGPLACPEPDIRIAKARVARIMVRSWLRKGAVIKALQAFWKIHRI